MSFVSKLFYLYRNKQAKTKMAIKQLTLKQVEDLAEEALNAACLVIQNAIGQTDGGNASIFFSDDEVRNAFISYIWYETPDVEIIDELEEVDHAEACGK